MIKKNFIVSVIASMALYLNIAAQSFPDPKVDSTLKLGIRYIVMQEYNEAKQTFTTLSHHKSGIPFAEIYTAAVLIVEAYDYGIPFQDDSITSYLDKAVQQCETLLDQNDEQLWYNYFAAVAYAYFAYYEALQQNWVSAFTDGIESIEYFDECIEIDENFHEAYVASASYTYWKARKTESIDWLPFFDDNREQAVKQLEKAVDHAAYNTFLAVNSLLWIYIDRNEAEKVIDITTKMLEQYPGSRFFMYPQARAYEDFDYLKANLVYENIIQSYKNENIVSKIRFVELYHKIAQNYKRLGQWEKALKYCDLILEMRPFTEFEIDQIGQRIMRVIELKNQCKDHLE